MATRTPDDNLDVESARKNGLAFETVQTFIARARGAGFLKGVEGENLFRVEQSIARVLREALNVGEDQP